MIDGLRECVLFLAWAAAVAVDEAWRAVSARR
jgi:hypothetical protein